MEHRHRPDSGHVIDIIFTLALFCVLAASLLTVVILGADVYRATADRMQENFELRTTLGYVSGKIHQNDASGGVSLGELDGVPALVLRQELNDTALVTYIYYYDGAVCEIFAGESVEVSPAGGQQIVKAADFRIEEPQKGLFKLSCTDSAGNSASVLAAVRSK